jgi:hypothetical protein
MPRIKKSISVAAISVSILLTIFASNSIADTLSEKIANRGTINAFNAWQTQKGMSGYGLYWNGDDNPNNGTGSQRKKTIVLTTPTWNYYYPLGGYNYPGIEPFLTDRNWNHDAEYGKTVALDISNPAFIPFFVNLVDTRKKTSNGVMLDWWHNHHSSGLSEGEVQKARLNLVKAMREHFGPDFVILGNVSWRKDNITAKYLSGVFLELYKEPYESSSNRLYTTTELKQMQGLLDFYQAELGYPKIIALEGWRKTKSLTDADRNSAENRRIAKIMTAMSAVIPDNGYILYGDNNPDTSNGDHDHMLYDFYQFDVGKPIKDGVKINSNSRYREFESGIIGYNLGSRSVKITLQGAEVVIEGLSAVFCKYGKTVPECSYN